MTTEERVCEQIDRFSSIASRRALSIEERAQLAAFASVREWMCHDEEETERIEREAALAEEQERLSDPHKATKDIFATYRTKLKREGRMR